MRKMKYAIIFLILFMVIGYATVSVSLSITGNANVISDLDDFNVYFSDVKTNDKQDLRLVKNDKELVFEVTLNDIGDNYKISYDVTNGSKLFDASLSINCTNGNEYLGVLNEFDTSNLASLSTRTGNLTLTKTQTNSEENQKHFTVTCTIVASPIGKETIGSGTVLNPVKPIELEIGDAIGIDGEYFNIISQTDTTVTMLAQYNLGTDYRQSTTENNVAFSNTNGWAYTPGPKEIDIQQYDGNAKTYVNQYVSYLKETTGNSNITGDFITLSNLKKLNCNINNDYSENDDNTETNGLGCQKSEYVSWLANGQSWWTKSAYSGAAGCPWIVGNDGGIDWYTYSYDFAIRPTITIPIELARLYSLKKYPIGDEVFIGDEKFNVIKDNGTSVTMLAYYNIDSSAKQITTEKSVSFSNTNGWAYTPGPKEIDIDDYYGNAQRYVNGYESYLNGLTNSSDIKVTLITLKELKSLGCTINDNYAFSDGLTCATSNHKSWLINNQYWWTRSAVPDNNTSIYLVFGSGIIGYSYYTGNYGIRPVITINKKYLN